MPDYDNSGILSKNERKSEDFHADYKGNATIGGIAYWIDAKVREKDGRKFMTLKFKPKDQAAQEKPKSPADKSWARPDYDKIPMDDDLPPF